MNATIQRLLDTKAKMTFHIGASVSQITNYENETNNKLPNDFKEWLLFSNGGEIFVPGTVLYGVDNNAKSSLLNENDDQKRGAFSLDDSLLVIGRFNFGDLLCIDLNCAEVVQWDHEEDEEYLRWNSFFEFIEEEITAFVSEE